MKITDINEHLKAPDASLGWWLWSCEPKGAFIVVTYRRTILKKGELTTLRYDMCDIYLNDFGREVCRVEYEEFPEPVANEIDWGLSSPLHVPVVPVKWYEKIWLYIQVYWLRRA